MARRVFHGPRHDRKIVTGGEYLEGAELLNLAGELYGHLLTGLVDSAVPGPAEPDEVVILGHDLAGRARKVDGQGGHCAAEIIDVEDQIRIKIGQFTPDDPTDARIDKTVFVAGGVDRLYARQAEAPEQVRLEERRHKCAACAVDMNRNVQAGE